MRLTIVDVDPNLLRRARQLTRIQDPSALVQAGLQTLIARESAKRLAALGGSEPELRSPRRRRPRTGSRPA